LNEPLKITLGGSGKQGTIRLKLLDATNSEPIQDFIVVHRHRAKMETRHNEQGAHTRKGKFALNNKYWVYCYAPGYEAVAVKAKALELDGDDHVEARMRRCPSLMLRLVSAESGELVADAKVMAAQLGSQEHPAHYISWGDFDRYVDGFHSFGFVQRKSTAQDGRVEFSRLATGDPAIIILAKGFQRLVIRPEQLLELEEIDEILQVKLKKSTGVFGKLTRNGKPVAGARVSISTNAKANGLDQMMESCTTDEKGQYELGSLSPGSYWVKVDKRGTRVEIGEKRLLHDVQLTGVKVTGQTRANATIRATPEFDADYEYIDSYADEKGNFSMTLQSGIHRFSVHYTQRGFHGNFKTDPITIPDKEPVQIQLRRPRIKPEIGDG